MKKKPVRLSKKQTLTERIQNWMKKNYSYLLLIVFIIAIIFFVIFVLMFVPGTESGNYYNGGIEYAVQNTTGSR